AAARGLRAQRRVAVERVVQLVEGWCLERGAVAGGQAQALAEVHAPGEAAGVVAAELVVVVVADRQLKVVAAEARLVLRERRTVAAGFVEGRGRTRDAAAVARPVDADGEQPRLRQGDVRLQAGAVAAGREAVGRGAGEIVVGTVHVAPRREPPCQPAAGVVAQLHARYLLQRARAVRQAPGRVGVVLVEALAAQQARTAAPAIARVEAGAQRDRVVLVAVAVRVGLVHAAAGEHRGGDAAAGVDAVAGLVAGIHAEPRPLAADVEARAHFAQAMAAGAGMETGVHAFARAAGEHLDDAADGPAAVQAGARAAHDLDALDEFERQVLQRRQAGGGGADAHAVHQEQGVVGFGAAQEQRGDLAEPALVGQVDAGAAAQQVLQRARLAALDRVAVDDLHRRERRVGGGGGAGGGDQDVVEVGGLRRGGGGQGEGNGQRGREDRLLQLHVHGLRRARPHAKGGRELHAEGRLRRGRVEGVRRRRR